MSKSKELVRGWWPSEEEALAALEADEKWKHLENGRWLRRGGDVAHSQEAAIAIASVRMAMGQDHTLTDVLTSELFEAVVKRLVEIERRLDLPF